MGLGDFLKSAVKTVGSVIPGIGDAYSAKTANEANIEQAQRQTAFQQRMSNTSYQRGMEDMRKAGLNPMLAYAQGGASVPQGVSAQIMPENRTGLGTAVASAAGLALQSKLADNTVKQTESNITLQNATSAKALADTANVQLDTAIKGKGVPAAKLQGELAEKGSGLINKLLQNMDTSAKSVPRTWEKWKKTFTSPPPVRAPLTPVQKTYLPPKGYK